MPQNRRKLPFSSKKKKDQIAKKRQTKNVQPSTEPSSSYSNKSDEDAVVVPRKLMEQPANRNKNTNRYNLQFFEESKEDLDKMRKLAYKPLNSLSPQKQEIGSEYFGNYDFPVRPEWDYSMAKETLNVNEGRYFKTYVDGLLKLRDKENGELSLFESNLETWRQLWRVLEFSDVLLIIVDVRYATLMFPPALYKHIVETLKKYAIVVLNKIDLVAPETVVAWRHYFQTIYPNLPTVLFASYSGRRKWSDAKRSTKGVHNIFVQCKKIVNCEIDLSSWEQKIFEDMQDAPDNDDNEPEEVAGVPQALMNNKNGSHELGIGHSKTMYGDGILTIGCIGFPNVGKSSLINAFKGRKVVSVSVTPGHTKHFQTIFLTNTVRLCDCPGLVFPSATPKSIQVLIGSYPISQLQVPYVSLKFLAENLNLPKLLNLQLPENCDKWSAAAIADAWALKQGFLTAKAGRPDRYRAANQLLRLCLSGRKQIILQFYPPDYHKDKELWLQHADVEKVKTYQNFEKEEHLVAEAEASDVSDDDVSSDDDQSATDGEEKKISSPKSENPFDLLNEN